MRRKVAAVVLALLVPLGLAQLSSTPAYAAPVGTSSDPYWDYYGLFDDFQECVNAGELGVGSSWITYYCHYLAGQTELWVFYY